MDRIIRCITSDGAIMVSAAETSDIVFKAKKIHMMNSVSAAALGRLLTASSLMGNQLKSKDASITLRVKGDGPVGHIIAVANNNGDCRGYVENPLAETTYYPNGKINVAEGVGKNGILNVMKDLGQGEPYVTQIELVSGEIAEDITAYYAKSEQIPTACALGVLFDKEDNEVLLAGGLLIQLLPAADDETINKLEKAIEKMEPVTTMLAKGMSIEDMCKSVLSDFEVEILDTQEINYICTCSREKVKNSIASLTDEEILSLADEKGFAEAGCHFCNKRYRFSKVQLKKIIENKNKK